MKIETIAIHAGNHTDASTKAVVQPIVMATTFERDADGGFSAGYQYSRSANPNRTSLENVLAQLEGGVEAAAFSSGNAAGMSVFQSLEPGTHIIAPDDMYHGLRNQLKALFAGILEFDFVDVNDSDVLQAHIKPNTGVIWIETPSNPLLKITDIKKVVAIARQHNIKVVCDNTFATPVCQNPLALGANLVMHSSTKYFGGHSDLMGGALITAKKSDWWEKIRNVQTMGGAVPSPMDCYYLVRSIKTLPYRVKGHVHNAQLLAAFLEKHLRIEQVMYPGLPSHPQYDIVKAQMSLPGAMMSFTLKGGEAEAKKVVNSLKIFTQATSLGGVESLIEHRASVEGTDTKTPLNLLRVSVGLEHIDDLIADLEQAMV
ncbi:MULTISPECIES: trans-sulfuration enzyme family protein [unclassified Mucilaginibacter]|uniref:trans-sulfuration enzyme family protein n=3 Tax=Mucilaginibacter TaxID=423349 RepID=UPI002AC8A6CE|nr:MULTISPECIES: aminotransferase class I/II-fold pyridoxal phosphate-dependent enzyme [unclassified Mucilaginibacter]MEB0261837.1 aminotransferase class I/II-fold pyridoxal phosphate-dependent enzyme [Mucilaginibacter sp. 10I4]MEB0278942.1 aminotransferase class I/II-fold pyridoxal phosphate-dependent enzyme [Mucilaginibacter sp. 10B2]WPX22123.1 aminotransferase class I/II-fold pyridoxal phosphate-dependent enzyme [Mucilaginibacter sp. 5C4]